MTIINITLDSTMITIFLGAGYLFTFILIGAYWHDALKELPVRTFFMAKCLQSAAWFLAVVRGEIPDFLSIAVANSFMFIGAALESIALLRLRNEWQRKFRTPYLLAALFSIAGFQLVILVHNSEEWRIICGSLFLAILLAPSYRMVKGPSSLMKVMGYAYLLVVAANLIRAATASFTDTSVSLFTPGFYQLIYLVSVFILTILGIMGFLLLWKEKSNQELLQYASYDDLTGALNRRMFTSGAKPLLEQCAKKRQHLSYLLFDIDSFKDINDNYGHHTGDLVLQDVVRRIRPLLGNNDLFVRYGGDEFGILLPGRNEPESSHLAEQIKLTLETAPSHLPVPYSLSIGVLTLVPDPHTRMETLYTRCDQALYAAKRNGRNRIARSQIS
ncbi:GGDEF domain-containing protein [Paenibacillus glycanilyticus]|uniref:GGDEF domain-containing protein n=1 Tax=Paenibacillus glycanilyticus TaxID=126569 RepID=UPI0024E08B19|nr:GGDEF domain-containing protein [Paenibacillus glycanilyticus]